MEENLRYDDDDSSWRKKMRCGYDTQTIQEQTDDDDCEEEDIDKKVDDDVLRRRSFVYPPAPLRQRHTCAPRFSDNLRKFQSFVV